MKKIHVLIIALVAALGVTALLSSDSDAEQLRLRRYQNPPRPDAGVADAG